MSAAISPADDTAATASALIAFAVGLPAFVMIKVFSPGFFAREDTRTPMIFAAISVAVNMTGSLLLFPHYAQTGIALATTAAGWVNAILLGGTLAHRRPLPARPAPATAGCPGF